MLPKTPNKFTSQTTKTKYAKTSCKTSSYFELHNVSEEIIKNNLYSLSTSEATGMGQIPTKFLIDDTEILALPLRNIINLSIKLLGNS